MNKTIDHKRAILNSWVKYYTEELFRYAYKKTSCTETAEDLVQDTFLVAFENHAAFESKSSPKTWLYAILKNKIMDYYRKSFKEPLFLNSDNDIYSIFFTKDGDWLENQLFENQKMDKGNALDDKKILNVLENCLNNLPKSWQLAVKLKFLTQKKGSEICEELGISKTNYWQIVHRAKLQLKSCIERNWSKV